LKIEGDNYSLTYDSQPDYSIDPIENPFLFFGVSSKRYVLYRKNGSGIEIIKNTEHGLGSFVSPDRQEKDWISEFWHNALSDYYHRTSRNVLYSETPAVSKQAITTKTLLERFERFNIGQGYDNSIKPFNFFHTGIDAGNNRNKPIIPILPFSNTIKNVTIKPFIDYKSGRKCQGVKYWKTLDHVYSGYFNHKETKFNGSIGHLSRKLVTINDIKQIGKETADLELSQILGIGGNIQHIEEYSALKGKTSSFARLSKRSKLRKLIDIQFKGISDWVLALSNVNLVDYGISKKVLYRVKKSIKQGNGDKLSKVTKLKFINYHNYMSKNKSTISTQYAIADNNLSTKEVIA
jgi:hypothetical protein